jgi:hypothetical protein
MGDSMATIGRRAPGLVITLVAASCRSPTEITLELTTDEPCELVFATGANITAGSFEELERKPPGARTSDCRALNGEGSLGSLVLVPSGPLDDPIAVRVVMGVTRSADDCVAAIPPDYSGCIVARRSLRYLPHTPLTLPIALRRACVGKECPGQTCVEGSCVDPSIDPSRCVREDGCGEGTLLPADGAAPPTEAGPGDATVLDAGAADEGASDAPADASDAGSDGGSVSPSCAEAAAGACAGAGSRLSCVSCCEQACPGHACQFALFAVSPCGFDAGSCGCPQTCSFAAPPGGACVACLLGASVSSCASVSCQSTSACQSFSDCAQRCP